MLEEKETKTNNPQQAVIIGLKHIFGNLTTPIILSSQAIKKYASPLETEIKATDVIQSLLSLSMPEELLEKEKAPLLDQEKAARQEIVKFLDLNTAQLRGKLGLDQSSSSQEVWDLWAKKLRDSFSDLDNSTNSMVDELFRGRGDSLERIFFVINNLTRMAYGQLPLPPLKPYCPDISIGPFYDFLFDYPESEVKK